MKMHNSSQVITSSKLCNLFNLNRQREVTRGDSPCPLASEGMKFHLKIWVCTTHHAQLEYYRTCSKCSGCSCLTVEGRHCSPMYENEVVQSMFFSGQKRPLHNLQKAVFVQVKNSLKFITAKRLKAKTDCHAVKANAAILPKNYAETWPRFGAFASKTCACKSTARELTDQPERNSPNVA